MTDKEHLKQIRKNIFCTAYKGGAGHLASAFSVVEILYVLYCKGILNYRPKDPLWEDRDRMIMSKGQGCLALYAILSKVGFFPESELNTFCQPGSSLGGEPKLGDVPGVEASTGSLGHGLSFAQGIAMAYKTLGKKNQVYVVIGDGECQEGSVWEAAMSASHFQLDNLTVIMDNNKLQAMGKVSELMSIEDWGEKWSSFGWDVSVVDGHDVEALKNCLGQEHQAGRPRFVIADTVKGKGVSFMEHVPIWHYRMPNEEELHVVIEELEIKKEELGI